MIDARSRTVGVDLHIVRGARSRHVRDAGVDEVRVCVRIHVDEHTTCGQPLRAVRGAGIAVVDVPHSTGVEGEDGRLVPIHPSGELRPVELLDRTQLAVGNVEVAIGSGERPRNGQSAPWIRTLLRRLSHMSGRASGELYPGRVCGPVEADAAMVVPTTSVVEIRETKHLTLLNQFSTGDAPHGLTFSGNSEIVTAQGQATGRDSSRRALQLWSVESGMEVKRYSDTSRDVELPISSSGDGMRILGYIPTHRDCRFCNGWRGGAM